VRLAGAYVNYFRSIPLLLVITWFYLAVPFVLRWITGEDTPWRLHLLPGGLHDVRGGVLLRNRPRRHPVDPQGPDGAAQALGMTYGQACA
jgi:glutamate/aspartate transport system permease protein